MDDDKPPFAVELLAQMAASGQTTRQHLEAAEALVPPDVIEQTETGDQLAECRRSGYYHFWMSTLQEIGKAVEKARQDELLPVEFWLHLVKAAQNMEFPEFVPYFLGKAERRPRRDFYDSLVAHVMLERMLPEPLRQKHAALIGELKPFVDWLEGLDASHAALFKPPIDAKALCERFLEAECIAQEAAKETDNTMNQGMMSVFNNLFSLVTDPELPEELRDAAWSIVCANTFTIVLREGTLTAAEVWWRG